LIQLASNLKLTYGTTPEKSENQNPAPKKSELNHLQNQKLISVADICGVNVRFRGRFFNPKQLPKQATP